MQRYCESCTKFHVGIHGAICKLYGTESHQWVESSDMKRQWNCANVHAVSVAMRNLRYAITRNNTEICLLVVSLLGKQDTNRK